MKKFRRWSFDDLSKNEVDKDLAINRIWKGPADIKFQSKFKLNSTDSFFTLGSCFARELETGLIAKGFKVLSRPSIIPSELFPVKKGVASQDFYNRYNLASMALEVENLLSNNKLLSNSSLVYENGDGLYDDCHYTPALLSSSLDEVLLRRERIVEVLSSSIKKADVFVLTLGLCEAWLDSVSGCHLNVISSPFMLRKYSDRLSFVNIDYSKSVEYVDRIVSLLEGKKIILSVSPVPLTSTFNDKDVIVANQGAKAVLRAVAEYAINKYDNVDYFPSYEMVGYSAPDFAWKSDGRHVSSKMVSNIIDLAISSYIN